MNLILSAVAAMVISMVLMQLTAKYLREYASDLKKIKTCLKILGIRYTEELSKFKPDATVLIYYNRITSAAEAELKLLYFDNKGNLIKF